MQEKLKGFFAKQQKYPVYYLAAGVVLLGVTAYLIVSNPIPDQGTPKGANTGNGSPATLNLEPNKDQGDTSANAGTTVVKTTTSQATLLPRGNIQSNTPPPPTGTPPPRPDNHDGLTFEEAMKLFGLFGYRYQFVNCRGTPGGFVMKQNVRFMLDNRDPIEHNIIVATQSFLIPGYDFAIAYARDLGNYMITCDGGGAAEINVVP